MITGKNLINIFYGAGMENLYDVDNIIDKIISSNIELIHIRFSAK